MALPGSGALAASAINTELGRSSTAEISLASAATGSYATINTVSASYPNASTPHGMAEWYSYNHSASSPTTLSGVGVNIAFTPGDGGGYIEIAFTINSPSGGEYVTLSGDITAGDPITSTGIFGPANLGSTSPATHNIALGNGAEADLTLRLYTSGGTLLDTAANFHTGPLPI